MPTYTTNKQIIKPTNGEYVNSWDVPVNQDWDIIDKALGSAISKDVSAGNAVLSTAECQNQRINATGFSSPNVRTVSVPSGIGGMWVLNNANTADVRFTVVGSANTLTIPSGRKAIVYSDGANPAFADDVRLAQGTGITVVDDTISLTSPVTTALGGTGQTTYTNGQLLIGNATGGLTKATLTAGTNVTITNGDGAITINSTGSTGGTGITSLTLDAGLTGLIITPNTRTDAGTMTFSGVINAQSGGTGASTLTGYVYGNGTGIMTASANIPTSALTGILPVANGGTGALSLTGYVSGNGTGAMTASATIPSSAISPALGSMSTQASSNVAITGGYMRASVGSVSTPAGYAFASGNAGFATVGSEAFLNLATLTSMYSGNTGTEINFSANGTLSAKMRATDFEVYGNAIKPGGGTWSAPSDQRLKTDVANYLPSTADLMQLRPVSYKYNGQFGTPDNGKTYVGLIAQEVQSTPLGSMVGTYNQDGVELLNLDTSQLVFALINAVKELNARVKVLEAKA